MLSPTAINTYLSCPRKYYFRYIKKLRTKPSIHLIRGQIVHKTIHQFHKNHPEMPSQIPLPKIRQELLDIFQEQWENAEGGLNSLGLSAKEIEFYRDDSMVMLLNFSHWLYKNGAPSVDSSETRIWSNNLGMMGIIDAALTINNKLVLVDYKTSKVVKITDDMQRQAALYALLYHDKYKTIPEAVWIHFLKVPADPLPIHIDDALLEYGRILIGSVRENTLSQNEEDYPCKCGGYCERDFIRQPKWTESMKN